MIVDTSVFLGAWPFRFVPWEGTRAIQDRLARNKISVAWVSMFEGLFHKDPGMVNERLVKECAAANAGDPSVRLVPFGVVDPRSPDWREDLKRCKEVHRMPGIRLFPGAHGYSLADAESAELLQRAADRELLVQIVVKIEDERTQHRMLRWPAVDLTALPGIVARSPALRVQLLNVSSLLADELLLPLARSGRVWFDFAMIEGVAGAARFAERVGRERLLLGSHFPLFYPESALLKLVESDLPEGDQQAIRFDQAAALVPVQ